MNPLRFIGNLLKDMFYGENNAHAELGRIVVGLSGALMGLAVFWDMFRMHQAIDLMALGGGLAAIITSGAGLIAAKQWAAAQQQLGETLKAKRMRDEGDTL